MRTARQDYLLNIISSFDGPIGTTQLVKTIFVEEARSFPSQPHYIFFRWYYGPYSKDLTMDLEKLVETCDVAKTKKGDSILYSTKYKSDRYSDLAKIIKSSSRFTLRSFLEMLYESFNIQKFKMGETIHFSLDTKNQADAFINKLANK